VGETTTKLVILRLKNCNSIGRGLDNYCHPALVFHFFELSATSTALLAHLSFGHNAERLEAQVFSQPAFAGPPNRSETPFLLSEQTSS
jgi:hypothetical protein